MQNNIYNFAIRSNDINKNILCEMCDLMDPKMRERFVNAILMVVDYKEVLENLPKTSKVGSRDCRLVSVNYLTGVVDYEYDETVTRYFRTEEEAQRLINEGLGKWDGRGKLDDEYKFEGTHTFTEANSCNIEQWVKGVSYK